MQIARTMQADTSLHDRILRALELDPTLTQSVTIECRVGYVPRITVVCTLGPAQGEALAKALEGKQ